MDADDAVDDVTDHPVDAAGLAAGAAVQRRRSPERAGQRVASLVISPLAGVATGQYFEGKPTPKRLSARELDREYQERAWQLGCRLVADAATASDRIVDRR